MLLPKSGERGREARKERMSGCSFLFFFCVVFVREGANGRGGCSFLL